MSTHSDWQETHRLALSRSIWWHTAARPRGGASCRRRCSPISPQDGRNAPLLFREQTLVRGARPSRELPPFDLLGFDTDSMFINDTVLTAWKHGDVRPTAKTTKKPKRGRRRPDPLVDVTDRLGVVRRRDLADQPSIA